MSCRRAGKRVLVTGAGRNIGLAIARRYAGEGARILLNDLTPERVAAGLSSLQSYGEQVAGYAADVRSSAAVRDMLRFMRFRFGGIDVCVHCAGIYPNCLVLDMIEEEEWSAIISVNLTGAFVVCQAAAREMVEQREVGYIITISSGSYFMGRVGSAHYCASRAGLVMYTRVLDMELAPYGISVNSIAPGLVETDLISAAYRENSSAKSRWAALAARGTWLQPAPCSLAPTAATSPGTSFV